MRDRKKIKLFQEHFVNIDTDFLYKFEHLTGTINFISFIKEECNKDFGIYLTSLSDVKKLDKLLKENYYKDRGEWLREKMRKKIKSMR